MSSSKLLKLTPAVIGILGLVIVGVWGIRKSNTQLERAVEGDASSASASATRARPWWSSKIGSRRVDSAARLDYEGAATDDWDEIGPEARMARVEALVLDLEQQIDSAGSDGQREQLRQQALQALSNARADFFMEAESKQWYLRHEARLEE